MELGLVRKVDIDQEMQQSYLDYAMSVIVARALPDARDGLKPVQRRILYAMYDMGLRPEGASKKSARIVGEVLGKYHPHGDTAVYEAMARLAQDFTIRDPLVEGQGNFGSVDGDPPAAMRYTEAKLTSFAMELLSQIDRDTVGFLPNFDDTLTEPEVLPAAAPNLLVNGASGIAVGMATNIPPHNLGEVVDALVFMLEKWDGLDEIAVDDLMHFIKGPDFPTGGIILLEGETNELYSAYGTGRGKITVRGRIHAEEMGRGRYRLIITELPYLTNKSNLIERIADLTRDGVMDGIADLRDESDRQGMRIVIELSKTAETDKVLRALYKHTPLQSTFGINLLALVGGEPRLLNLKQALKVYIEHRLEVVKRRSQFDLDKAEKRAHILEGLRIAIKNLDEVISIIRNAADVGVARERLMKRYKLSEIQANSILDMQLRRLSALERKKIDFEYKELQQTIKDLKALLSSPRKMRELVSSELQTLKQTYADRRRTQIVTLEEGASSKELLTSTALTPSRVVWVGMTDDGNISRSPADKISRPGGKQSPRWLIQSDSHQTLYLVAEDGKATSVLVQTLPENEKFGEGVHFAKISPFEGNEKIANIFSLPVGAMELENQYVVTVTREGMIKKSSLSELPGPSSQKFSMAKVTPDDSIVSVLLTEGDSELLLVTAQGMSIRFSEQEVRPMGLVAVGVNGIKLKPDDYVVSVEQIKGKGEVIFVSMNGRAWNIPFGEFPTQGRYGQGVNACKLAKGDLLAGSFSGNRSQQALIHFQQAASRLLKVNEVPSTRRSRVGDAVITVKDGDRVTTITVINEMDEINDSLTPSQENARKPRLRKTTPKMSLQETPGSKTASTVVEKKTRTRRSENAYLQKAFDIASADQTVGGQKSTTDATRAGRAVKKAKEGDQPTGVTKTQKAPVTLKKPESKAAEKKPLQKSGATAPRSPKASVSKQKDSPSVTGAKKPSTAPAKKDVKKTETPPKTSRTKQKPSS